jgi:soluble lytic murein transglycosylase
MMSTLPMHELRRSVPGARRFGGGRAFLLLAVGLTACFLLYLAGSWLWARPAFHKDLINKYAVEYHFDPLWLMAVVRVESRFAPWAHSHRGAVGLMQLLPSTARDIAPEIGMNRFKDEDLRKPEVNIHLGVYYLFKLRNIFPDDDNAVLSAYNAGPGVTQTWRRGKPALEIDDIEYPETRHFVKHVQNTYGLLKIIQSWKRFFGMEHGR